MNFLVIDGAQDKINFFSIFNNNSYHKTIKANKNNNEKLSMELFKFFEENSIKQSKLKNIIVNQGPGKFSGIRSTIAVAKALSITNKLDLYGFNSNDLNGTNYDHVINWAVGTEYFIMQSQSIRLGVFSNNTSLKMPTATSSGRQHIDLIGFTYGYSFHRGTTSITIGGQYLVGKGRAQVYSNDSKIFDYSRSDLSFIVAAGFGI